MPETGASRKCTYLVFAFLPTFAKSESETALNADDMRPWQILIPPGVAHGYKVIGSDPAMLVYVTSRFYNPADELRVPYNDPRLAYDWETQFK